MQTLATRVDRTRISATVADLGAVWRQTNPAERKELAVRIVPAIYCYPDKPEELWVQLDPALHPQWEGLPKCITWVTDGARTRFWNITHPSECGVSAA